MFCPSCNILNGPIEVNCSLIFASYIFIGQIQSFIKGILVYLQARRMKSILSIFEKSVVLHEWDEKLFQIEKIIYFRITVKASS